MNSESKCLVVYEHQKIIGKIQMKMPFGKYKGVTIENLPSSYLKWLVGNINDEERQEHSICLNAVEEYQFRETYNSHFEDD